LRAGGYLQYTDLVLLKQSRYQKVLKQKEVVNFYYGSIYSHNMDDSNCKL